MRAPNTAETMANYIVAEGVCELALVVAITQEGGTTLSGSSLACQVVVESGVASRPGLPPMHSELVRVLRFLADRLEEEAEERGFRPTARIVISGPGGTA